MTLLLPKREPAEKTRQLRRRLNVGEACDLEMLLSGAFAPLDGFLCREDYEAVLARGELATSGHVWPIPVVLPFFPPGSEGGDWSEEVPTIGQKVALVDEEDTPVGTLEVESVWKPDLLEECLRVAGTDDPAHPYVNERLLKWPPTTCYAGGRVVPLAEEAGGGVRRYDFKDLRLSPAQTRALFAERGWKTVLAFQTRNPMHRCHVELVKRAALASGVDGILVHPAVGPTQPGDVDYRTRVRCYRHALARLQGWRRTRGDGEEGGEEAVLLALLPLRMRMCGPREAVWHALIRRNFGCTHFVVGRDHAGPSARHSATGEPFYAPLEAHAAVERVADRIGIRVVLSPELAYVPSLDRYMSTSDLAAENGVARETTSVSGTELRRRLANGEDIPEWFTFPEIVAELREAPAFQPADRRGFVVYLTGLSAAGKSTIAKHLEADLAELVLPRTRRVTVLDGDVARRHLSKGLGFSRADRSTNVRRIGFAAALIARHGGVAICANIAPFAADRAANREAVVEAGGTYIEVHVATPFEVCAARDPKGLYAKARAGQGPQMTGWAGRENNSGDDDDGPPDHAYEVPESPDVRVGLDPAETPEQAARAILDALCRKGCVCRRSE